MEFSDIAALAKDCRKLCEALDTTELDKRIAERSGDENARESAESDYRSALNAWHAKYLEGRDALAKLCAEHLIHVSDLRSFL